MTLPKKADGSSNYHDASVLTDQQFFESECCRQAESQKCWDLGYRNHGDASGTANKQCPAGAEARSEHDHHKPSSPANAQKECCQQTCWQAGWRSNGGTQQHNGHTCPTSKPMARPEHDGHKTSNPSENECCKLTCSTYAPTTCSNGGKRRSADDGHSCSEGGCTLSDCCPLPECFKAAKTMAACPDGKASRGETDMHQCERGTACLTLPSNFHNQAIKTNQQFFEDQCCKPTCATYTTACSADKPKKKPDTALCDGSGCREDQCCGEDRFEITCPAGQSAETKKSEFSAACCHSCAKGPADCAALLVMVLPGGCYNDCAGKWLSSIAAKSLAKYQCNAAQKKSFADAHPAGSGGNPQICCKGMTASCLACSSGQSIADYCTHAPTTHGCDSLPTCLKSCTETQIAPTNCKQVKAMAAGCASTCTTELNPMKMAMCSFGQVAVCGCRSGTAATGAACTRMHMEKCASCNNGFTLTNGKCTKQCVSDDTVKKVCCNGVTFTNEGKARCGEDAKPKCFGFAKPGGCGSDCFWSGHDATSCAAQDGCAFAANKCKLNP